jgi:hypothetical protein
MVRGLDRFRLAFAAHPDAFVLIGGTATWRWPRLAAPSARPMVTITTLLPTWKTNHAGLRPGQRLKIDHGTVE